jgi:outer membrane cobalamin receptor
MKMMKDLVARIALLSVCFCTLFALSAKAQGPSMLSGRVVSTEKEVVDFATVYLKDTNYGCTTDQQGLFHLKAPAGNYTLIVSAVGYKKVERPVRIDANQRERLLIKLAPESQQLEEVTVLANGVGRVKRSAFNAVAVDAKEMQNSTKSLSEALAKAPGVKLRESGGVGSDSQVTLDGFSGKHVKIFIDGVPQEGAGNSFNINQIPVSVADRIEVYKGVVPVGFGTDALGGVINVVTKKQPRGWFADASYSYGSFNTHKSNIHFGQTFRGGWTYEVNAFQNYSDNDYKVDSPVEDFETGAINRKVKEHVKRFNDAFHNEAVMAKVGITGKSWADKLMVGLTYAQMYKEIQTGVRQEIVYGEKHQRGHSWKPSLEYSKRNLLTRGLDLSLSASYVFDATTNIDTASYEYNWRGERQKLNSPGEQSYQHARQDNRNLSATLNLNYRVGRMHFFTLSHVLTAFHRQNTSLLAAEEEEDAIAKQTTKQITGLSYRLMPKEHWNFSVFAKYYQQHVAGPMAETDNASNYVRTSRDVNSLGFGAAGTYFILPELQAKVSYEKAYRLPTIEEMFGDESLEVGDISIRPEQSHNVNFNLSFNKAYGVHSVYAEGGLVYRYTSDYIQRNIISQSGGKSAASYVNYGKVLTKGFNLSARYGYKNWLSVGGNLTRLNMVDNQKMQMGTNQENITYKNKMPNVPYYFADMDVSLTWFDAFAKSNKLTFTYDNQYMHSFSYYSSAVVGNNSDYMVPKQFSHNVALSYGVKKGKYNFSVECRNLTNEKLYDNFSLQKAGRAVYGKVRVHFGSR